jgi:hypothetical protein
MFARRNLHSSISRAAVMATLAAVALTSFEPSTARAGSAPANPGLSTATSGATDFSARRYYRGGGGGGAAAAAAFAGIVGTGIAIAASQNYRNDYYYGGGPAYYGGGPGYYGGGPVYYGGGPYYGSQSYSNGGWYNGGNYNGHGGW